MLQKLLYGEGTFFEKSFNVCLRLRGSEGGEILRADREKRRGIPRRELPGERGRGVRAEPRRGGHEPAERCAERLGTAAIFQMQKVFNVADALPRPQPLGKADCRDLAEDRLVVARGKCRFPALRQRCGIPGILQKLRRCGERNVGRYVLNVFRGRRAQRAEALALLGAPDIVHIPGVHAAAVPVKPLRLRQKRGDQLVRPATALERARRP